MRPEDIEYETRPHRRLNEGRWLLVMACVAAFFFVSRFGCPGNDVTNWREAAFWWMVWKDLAHIFVGFCIAAAVFYRPVYMTGRPDNHFRWGAIVIMLAPSLLELLFAIIYPHGR